MSLRTGRLTEAWLVADYADIPARYVGNHDLMPAFWQHREARVNSYLEPDVFVAAADLDIELELVEEMYQGQYNRDEGFACQMASDLGLINADAVWPGNRIDWSAAARELMYDYGESRGILLSDELLKIL